MKYRVTHTTKYTYSENVTLCHNIAHLLPRITPSQSCQLSQLLIDPLPANVNEWSDLFGNRRASFSIQMPHKELSVTAISEVEVFSSTLPPGETSIGWEQAVEYINTTSDPDIIDNRLYVLESDFTDFIMDVVSYSKPSFRKDRPLLDAVENLMHRIHQDFKYDPGFSTIATPLKEVLKHKKGVCQDFAHLAITCLRMQGLAARYVSGYLETIPPQGKEKLVGADASHAWFSVYVPHLGWVDFDPTNAKIPKEQHITVAWGRDYADVAPLKGIIFGGGKKNRLDVSVDVERIKT
jgi:transglutaminase-like putative cysteine protease